MKSLVLCGVAVLVVWFVSAEAFAQDPADSNEAVAEDSGLGVPERVTTAASWRARAAGRRADANVVTPGLEFLADANSVRNRLKEFEGLEQDIEKLSRQGRREIQQWRDDTAEDQLDSARAVHKQAVAELLLIRTLAVDEGAAKTIAAIDGVLLDREERYGQLLRRMEAARERVRRDERMEGEYERGGRYTRGRPYNRRYRERDPRMREYDGRMSRDRRYDRSQGTYPDRYPDRYDRYYRGRDGRRPREGMREPDYRDRYPPDQDDQQDSQQR